jgi:hypothetical protein
MGNEKPLREVVNKSQGLTKRQGAHYHRHASNVDNAKIMISQFQKGVKYREASPYAVIKLGAQSVQNVCK